MRKCKKCGEEKDLEKFRKRRIWFSHTCKLCYAAKYRTGKPNLGRFVKGQTPWIKGRKNVTKRVIPRYEKKGRPLLSEHNQSGKRAKWGLDVKTRDGFKCFGCKTEKDLHAHHIIPWKQDESKRFDLNNGITLCRSCHTKFERLFETARGMARTRIRN